MDAVEYVRTIATAARSAARALAVATGDQRNAALRAAAAAVRKSTDTIRAANAKDLEVASQLDLADAMIDRLRLTDARIEAMAVALEQIAAQSEPVGETISGTRRPNGLRVERHRVPLGVVGVIFESRPNVTADAGGLCLKSSNACILRGGKEALHSNGAIAAILREAVAGAGLPAEAVTMIDVPDRAVVEAMARAEGLIDVIIPRGGAGLIRAVVDAATIPVIKHYAGVCHVYVHTHADAEMAERIILNAKCQRPGVCNAAETLLVDQAIADRFLPKAAAALQARGVELRGCPQTCQAVKGLKPAAEGDWHAEYLDLILAVKVVDDLPAAVAHINTYGSGHTDAIVTNDIAAAEAFTAGVDSGSIMVNASTRFSDGGEYGLGAEIGISTDKLHARGPMGAADLTTTKWIVTGSGHVRQ